MEAFTLELIEAEMQRMEKAKASFLELVEQGLTYDEVRVLLINQLGITWGKAADTVDMLERATGRTLER
jgi:hypothetical protein